LHLSPDFAMIFAFGFYSNKLCIVLERSLCMPKSNSLLSTREFAQKAGVSTGTVSKWLRQGMIDGQKTGNKWSIPAAELSKVTPKPGESTSPSKPPVSKPSAASEKTDSDGTSYTIREFSEMTYLTPLGVEKWLKEGRLKKAVDAKGQLRVDGSNLDIPDIKRLLR
jgi:excisionase family DNA binding protein